MDIRALGPADGDAVVSAGRLFDSWPRWQWTETFLTSPGHHVLVAYVERTSAGFVTGVEMTHPDKGTEMFLCELGVDEPFRGRGVGRRLVAAGGTMRGAARMLAWDFAAADQR